MVILVPFSCRLSMIALLVPCFGVTSKSIVSSSGTDCVPASLFPDASCHRPGGEIGTARVARSRRRENVEQQQNMMEWRWRRRKVHRRSKRRCGASLVRVDLRVVGERADHVRLVALPL